MHSTLAPITRRVSRWAGVDIDPTPDGVTLRVAGHLLARLVPSGDLLVPTEPALRDQLLTEGFADPIPGRPDRVRYRVRSPADVSGAIRLLRVAYLSRLAARDPFVPVVAFDDHLRRLDGSPELLALLVGPTTADPTARREGRRRATGFAIESRSERDR
ncbi:luciferase family protein [Salinigranum sp. GCM10025319]|uniref:luciferase domain-containing protein n=1 Tax=Salinigranum sp. GCM10025319 TaxID=3252687 RepID=UPI00361095D8